MGGGDENHPIMGSAGGEPGPIISFFIGIITIIIALQRLPPLPTNLPLFPPLHNVLFVQSYTPVVKNAL